MDTYLSARNAMQFRKGAYRNAWATADVRRLRDLAGQGISPGQAAKLLRRSESAVRNKAGLHGISFQRQTQLAAVDCEILTSPAAASLSP
jgi:hypothetical protein